MQTNEPGLTEPTRTEPADPRRLSKGIAHGAAIIAGLTMASRLLGLLRTLVFSQTVGAGCLGTAYVTAYQVPNLISELVLGGALTSAMVPVLARSAARAHEDPRERERVGQITSALLTWVVIILAPLTLILLAVAGPVASLLIPANPHAGCVRSDMVGTTTGMLEVFAPQVLFYGVSVVLFGLLQAYRRFVGPSLAPVVASLVLIASYVVFVPLDHGLSLARTPVTADLALSVGATLSIAVLVVVAIPPTWRLHLRFRPALRLPREVARLAGGMAVVGVVEFLFNDLSTVVVIALANGRGDTGALVIFNYAWLVFNAIAAVLAVSIVTSTFPVLSSRDGDAFDRTCAGSTRAVLLMAWLGSAVMVAVAVPAAHILAHQPDQVSQLVEGFILFAPGVTGFALVTCLSRVMFAIRRLRVAALALGGSWLLVTVADVVLVELVPSHLVVGALALGNTIGQSLVAIPMVIATRRLRGKPATHRVGRAAITGLLASAVAGAVGGGLSLALPTGGNLVSGVTAVVTAVCATLVFGVIAYVFNKEDMKAIARRLHRVVRPRAA